MYTNFNTIRTPNILVLDNSQDGELAALILENDGLDAVRVTSDSDACTAMQRGRFDALILGWNYEGFDAFSFAKKLCSQFPHLRRSSIVVMADHKISLQARRMLSDFGIRWILEKPVVATSLPKLIRHVISQRSGFEGIRRFTQQVALGETASALIPAVC